MAADGGLDDWDPFADPAGEAAAVAPTALDRWDPLADPADAPSAVAEAWKPKSRRRKPAVFAFPFPESEGDTESSGGASSTELEPAHWGEDPALEALTGSLGHLVVQAKETPGLGRDGEEETKEEQDDEDEDLPVLIDDGDLGPRTERLLRSLRSADLEGLEVFADVQTHGELRDLALQACVISKACFAGGGTFRMADGRHLALLVDSVQCVTVGYCLYNLAASSKEVPRRFLIEELGIAEAHRLKGYGSKLLSWAKEAASTERCVGVSISALGDLERFLRPLGFRAGGSGQAHGQDWAGIVQWELPLEVAPLGRAGIASPPRPWAERDAAAARDGVSQEPEEASAGRLRLVCFLASHVSSRERLDRLADTLASIARQEPQGPPEVFLSWSAATGEFREGARALFGSFRGAIPGLHAMEQEAQLSQFLHHAAALRRAGAGLRADGWVLFSDDDDLWHPRRYSEFLYAASQVHDQAHVKSVSALGHAQLRLNVEPRAVRPKDVDKLLMQGPLVCSLTDAERKAADIPEYFDVAVRNEQFKNFLLRTPRAILASKFCDRRFVLQFSVQGWGVAWFRPTNWLYYYSRADGITLAEDGGYKGGASFAVSVAKADHEAAARHERSRPLAGGHAVSQMPAGQVAFLVASLRASIEEQGITLEGLDKGWVRAEQLRIVCAMAVQSRAGISEADGRLWTWGRDVAWDVAKEVCKGFQAQIVE